MCYRDNERWGKSGNIHVTVNLSHTSHNALDKYSTMHNFITEMSTHAHIFVTKWYIVRCGTNNLWNMGLVHRGSCETGLLYGSREVAAWNDDNNLVWSTFRIARTLGLFISSGQFFISKYDFLSRHDQMLSYPNDSIKATLNPTLVSYKLIQKRSLYYFMLVIHRFLNKQMESCDILYACCCTNIYTASLGPVSLTIFCPQF